MEYLSCELREKKKEVKFWSDEEIQIFINTNFDTDFISLYALLINTGLRIGEALGLKFSKISSNFGKAIAVIDEQWKTEESRFSPPKHGSVRNIPLNSTVLKIISDNKRIAKRNQVVVFADQKGHPLSYDDVRRDFGRCCKRAGVKNIGLHGLRDVYITHYLMRKPEDWLRVKELAGHKDFKTTLGYTNFVKEFLLAEPEVFNVPLAQVSQAGMVVKIR